MRLWSSIAVAAVGSALAITINLATETKHSWWAWLGVILLTVIGALLSRRKSESIAAQPELTARQESASNTVLGHIDGDLVQAHDITGDIVFGTKRSDTITPTHREMRGLGKDGKGTK